MRLNNSGSTLASSYTAGAGTLAVVDGTQFGTPSSGDPLRVTVFTVNPLLYTIYLCTGVSSNTLTIGTAQEGTTDRNYSGGAFVENLITAGDVNGLDTRIATNATNISTNTTDIATNTTDLGTLTTTVTGITSAVTTAGATKLLGGASSGDPAAVTVGSGLSLSGTTLTAGGVAIGSSVTSGSSGSVLYVDGSGDLAQNNAGFYFDPTNGVVSIGAHAPSGFNAYQLWISGGNLGLTAIECRNAPTDEKHWYTFADNTGSLWHGTWDDNLSVGNNYTEITRSGWTATGWYVDVPFVVRGSVQPRSTSAIGLAVEAVASQTGDLIQCQNSSGSPISGFDPSGCPYAPSGSTGSRPSVSHVGCQYFDTTISKPVWYSGSGWVDASGASV